MLDSVTGIIVIAVLILLPFIMYIFIRFNAFILEKFIGILPIRSSSNIGTSNGQQLDKKTMETISQNYRSEQQILSSARWFYWIAGLSVVNLCVQHQGMRFVVGLGSTELINAVQNILGFSMVFLLNSVIVAIFILFGVFANKRYNWAFIIGMIIYGLDGLLFLLIKDYMSIGFHIFAIIMIFKGFQANQQLTKQEKQQLENTVGIEGNIFTHGEQG